MAKCPPLLKVPAIRLEASSHVVLHRQLYRVLRDKILSGELSKGERLPSSRALAETLGVSRNTVLSAYQQLAAENYVVAKVGSGTRVAEGLPHMVRWGLAPAAPVPQAVISHAGRKKGAFSLAAVLKQSHHSLWHTTFQDQDGNVLYLYGTCDKF